MFLLTMLKTPYMKTKLVREQTFDSILYSYASLLHRWKHFYRRTQILQCIESQCPSSSSANSPPMSKITCSVCCQPVVGQYFLCALCGHGGHLRHMHGWFSTSDTKHRCCPEKDCTCRCIIKQQELLATNISQIQQHTPTLTPKSYYVRPTSAKARAL